MKVTFKTTALAVLVSLGVVGCGSSSDNEETAKPEAIKPVAKPIQNQTTEPVAKTTENTQITTVIAGKDNGKGYEFLVDPKRGTTIKGKSELEAQLIKFDNSGFSGEIPTIIVKNQQGQNISYKYKVGEMNRFKYSEILAVQGYYSNENNNVGNNENLWDTLFVYAGNPTNSQDLKNLRVTDNGIASYTGLAFSVAKEKEGDYERYPNGIVKLNVDFKDESIEGHIKNINFDNLKYGYDIALKDGKIKEQNGELVFNGDASYSFNTSNMQETHKGIFEGKFMGPNAAELAGSIDVDNTNSRMRPYIEKDIAIFNAKKDKK